MTLPNLKSALAEIVRLGEAATAGPWTFGVAPQPNGCPIIGSHGLMVAMLAHSIKHPEQKETALANAAFIARVRTIGPQAAKGLLVAIEGLEAVMLYGKSHNFPEQFDSIEYDEAEKALTAILALFDEAL